MKKKNAKVVVIVDGYSAGRLYPSKLQERGFDCIHVQSTPVEMPMFKLTDEAKREYKALYTYDGSNLTKLSTEIQKNYPIECVIAGSEPGVKLANQLATVLNLKRNEEKLLSSRRNKFDMIESVRSAGLKTAKQIKTNNLDHLKSWVSSHNEFPVVLKPLDSAGSDNVFICSNMKEVVSAFKTITETETIFCKLSTEVLCQSFLKGDEYVVNLASCEGRHFCVEIRMYHKQNLNGMHIYDYEELIDFEGAIQKQLILYAKKVADAVGIKYGPSHVEIIMTKEGPALVEIAARLSGATNIEVSNQCLGYNVVDLTLDSYLNKNNFMHFFEQKNRIKKYEFIIDVAVTQNGVIRSMPIKKRIEGLESIMKIKYNVKEGDTLVPTVSLVTSPIKIHMVHSDRSVLKSDLQAIKNFARNGFICLSKASCSSSRLKLTIVRGLVIGVGLFVAYRAVSNKSTGSATPQLPSRLNL